MIFTLLVYRTTNEFYRLVMYCILKSCLFNLLVPIAIFFFFWYRFHWLFYIDDHLPMNRQFFFFLSIKMTFFLCFSLVRSFHIMLNRKGWEWISVSDLRRKRSSFTIKVLSSQLFLSLVPRSILWTLAPLFSLETNWLCLLKSGCLLGSTCIHALLCRLYTFWRE